MSSNMLFFGGSQHSSWERSWGKGWSYARISKLEVVIYEKTRLRRWPDREHIRENVDRFAHPWRRGSMLLSLGLRRKCIIKHHVILFLIRARMFTWSFTFPFSFPLLSLSRYVLYIPLSFPVFLSSVFNPLFVCSYIYWFSVIYIYIYAYFMWFSFLFLFYYYSGSGKSWA